MKVVFAHEAHRKMLAYVNASYPEGERNPHLREITGWGTVTQRATGDLYIDEVFLMPQEATSAHVEMDMAGWAALVAELAQAPDGGERLSRLNMWWHSHPFSHQTRVDFSTIDTGTMDRFEVKDGFLLSVVTDHTGLMTARYDQWTPTRQRLELPITVERELPTEDESAAIRAEVVAKVRYPGGATSYKPPGTPIGSTTSAGATHSATGRPPPPLPPPRSDGVSKGLRWQVWRIDVDEPYEVASHKKKKDAESDATQLMNSLSVTHAQYEVYEKNDVPSFDTMYRVRRSSEFTDVVVYSTPDLEHAVDVAEGLVEQSDRDATPFEYTVESYTARTRETVMEWWPTMEQDMQEIEALRNG
jgi:hypothetical protein